MKYVELQLRLNMLVARRKIYFLEIRNIFFVFINFMLTKKIKTIALTAHLLDEEETSEVQKGKKTYWVLPWLYG